MEYAKAAIARGKRGPTEDLEGPRRRDPDGEPRAEGGTPSAASGEAKTGEPTLTEARGPEQDAAAAAAGDRDDAEREEGAVRQPGQGGGRTEGRIAPTRRPDEVGARRAGTAAGLETVAEEEEEAPDDAIPAEAEGTAAAQGAAGAEDPFNGMVEGFPGSFWTAVADENVEQPDLLNWNDYRLGGRLKAGYRRGSGTLSYSRGKWICIERR